MKKQFLYLICVCIILSSCYKVNAPINETDTNINTGKQIEEKNNTGFLQSNTGEQISADEKEFTNELNGILDSLTDDLNKNE